MMPRLIQVNWPAPHNVKALSTTRLGGVSHPPYDGLNLGLHVQDDSALVWQNRQLLMTAAHLPQQPYWLNQTHSTDVVRLVGQPHNPAQLPAADASVTMMTGQVCLVMTADCLPLLICDKAGSQVAAIHAGWRGLLDGVIENTLAKLSADPKDLLVWLGPAISQVHFQVGCEVRDAFITHDPQASSAFIADGDKWLADLYLLARQRLRALAVNPADIYGGGHCTYREIDLFYSYRRDSQTGRQASLIYLESQ
ncbi:peptidoglycan editing factor PgeF [Moritella marina ATCC 15381]|uniref:Purine nucleoside phosphorylase n=1 Tax=Moritella marina ATCC 15381 TaxID=1202962 RepID=A0A5J6WUE2_MORMI|nr:peptidoglycan editing factor PgeF [Moritella marina]QFI40012.1 peptidoglycan editing factor PgeF [Moritella marina ATCC 15381]